MKYLISILIILNISCINKNKDISRNASKSEIQLDDLMNETLHAKILFHHQIQKISIIGKVYQDKKEIETLFSIIGPLNKDTSCNQGGFFNRFGEIILYKDTLHRKQIAELHFVINNECEGIYLDTGKEIRRYYLTKNGKELILEVYNQIKNKLK